MKKVAILQSSYIPWKGYFDLINDVDCFIFLDDVQMTHRDWRNRNKIKIPQGLCWLTIPVGSHKNRLINQVEITSHTWQKKHFHSFIQHYARAPYLKTYTAWLEEMYLARNWTNISTFNQHLIKQIARRWLGIDTQFLNSQDFEVQGEKTSRLISLLQHTHATHYISGPSAKVYLDASLFQEAEIVLEYKIYPDYPEYEQLHGSFQHQVSILDLLFHTGPHAPYYIWGWKRQ